MPVKYQNFDHSYKLKGKPVFAPTDLCRRIGNDIKGQVQRSFIFPDYYYHLKSGGHIAALHLHRSNRFFCKVDIKNFFYSCGRNRVADSLKRIGIKRHHHYARWSCVKNPIGDQPSYSLPYGFIQSPILASLVLAHSPVGIELDQLRNQVSISVFVDDISVSSNDPDLLSMIFDQLRSCFDDSPFSLNENKTIEPTERLQIFNCKLAHQVSSVTQERINEFYATDDRSEASIAGFEDYCLRVAQ